MMKKIIKTLIFFSPDISLMLGIIILFIAEQTECYSLMYGDGSPAGKWKLIFFGAVIIGIGVVLAKIRHGARESKRRNKQK